MLALDATLGTMKTTAPSATSRSLRRILLAALVAMSATGAHAADMTLKADYLITIAGITIGKVNATGRFTDTGYAATISGQTYGISRFVSDARAVLAGNGRIRGSHITPATYELDTKEKGFQTHVSMAMRAGSVVDLSAAPHLLPAPDRVPVTSMHRAQCGRSGGRLHGPRQPASGRHRRQRLQSHRQDLRRLAAL